MGQRDIVVERTSYTTSRNSLIVSLSVGAFVGFFGWLLALGVDNWILSPVFCRSSDSAAVCVSAPLTAWIIAYCVLSTVGLFMLIRANVFRPLLVVIAALATLWAIGLWFPAVFWGFGLLWGTVLFALAYALYAWLASIENFLVSAIMTVVIVILMRLLIVL